MIELKLTEQELQALAGLIDAGVRSTGLRGVKEAAVLLDKIERAAEAAKAAESNVVKLDDEKEAS